MAIKATSLLTYAVSGSQELICSQGLHPLTRTHVTGCSGAHGEVLPVRWGGESLCSFLFVGMDMVTVMDGSGLGNSQPRLGYGVVNKFVLGPSYPSPVPVWLP